MGNPRVSVVITGFEARHYDELLDFLTLFYYGKFIRKLMYEETKVSYGDKVVELGVGNGRNAILLSDRVGDDGVVVGFDISPDMLKRAKEKTRKYGNIKILRHDIRKEFTPKFYNYFDVALISLAFHGFEPEDKERIFENVRNILKNGGRFFILDYNQIELAKAPRWFKILIERFECSLAEDFLNYDLLSAAKKFGFELTKKKTYFKNTVQYSEFTLKK